MERMEVDTIVYSIITGIARIEQCDPDDLDFRLQDLIDVDALQRLVKHDGTDWTMEFIIDGHRVEVQSFGGVSVDGRAIVQD